jgi:hypothetical protein
MNFIFTQLPARWLLPTVAFASLICPGMTSPAQEASSPAGFTALFNGKDLTGWYGWGTRNPQDLWSMSEAEQADYKAKSVAGGLIDNKGTPQCALERPGWRTGQ